MKKVDVVLHGSQLKGLEPEAAKAKAHCVIDNYLAQQRDKVAAALKQLEGRAAEALREGKSKPFLRDVDLIDGEVLALLQTTFAFDPTKNPVDEYSFVDEIAGEKPGEEKEVWNVRVQVFPTNQPGLFIRKYVYEDGYTVWAFTPKEVPDEK